MFHTERTTFQVSEVESAEDLAQMLSDGRTWTLCQGFRHAGYLFLNDSTSEDGAQEYAVYEDRSEGPFQQLDSITASWMSVDEALKAIHRLTRGGSHELFGSKEESFTLQTREQHGTCQFCR